MKYRQKNLFTDEKRVLDATCGSRMMWFDRDHPEAIFVDKRKEEHILCDGRVLTIDPEITADFTALPFPDESFYLVVFDPPHLKRLGKTSWMAKKYGKLDGNWQETIRKGFSECMRVLKCNGTLIFKWNENQIKTKDVLKLIDKKPLFGHPSGRNGQTIWMTFIK